MAAFTATGQCSRSQLNFQRPGSPERQGHIWDGLILRKLCLWQVHSEATDSYEISLA